MTKEEFLKDVTNYNNHRYLLWQALEATSEGEVVEMGCGFGSTPFLSKYCKDKNLKLASYENDLDWYGKCLDFHNNITHLIDWGEVSEKHLTPAVLFIDHRPGERRKMDLERFAMRARIIVIHDSEPAADHGYQMRQHFGKFKYTADWKTDGAWASVLSNFIDVSTWGN